MERMERGVKSKIDDKSDGKRRKIKTDDGKDGERC